MIKLNFIPFSNQNFEVTIYRKLLSDNDTDSENFQYGFAGSDDKYIQYVIMFKPTEGYEAFKIDIHKFHTLVAKALYFSLKEKLGNEDYFINKSNSFSNKKIHFVIETHPRGKKTVWVEPYFLKAKGLWGLLFDYSFIVENPAENNFKLDKEILIASGTLNDKGNSNVDFYLFKHSYLKKFVSLFLPTINSVLTQNMIGDLVEVPQKSLSPKTYLFGNNATSTSSYMGLLNNPPLSTVKTEIEFHFIYKHVDRDIAVAILRGLRGDTFSSTFPGMEKLFKIPFSNDKITGLAIDKFDDQTLDAEIEKIKLKTSTVIPIIITNSKKEEDDDELYYKVKHKFTNAGIPCQVITKELVNNNYSFKYSLSNIGLQIFSKVGGQPWKMKSTSADYLIVGIGQSYNLEVSESGNKVDKNITYSVLTDSSGLFKDIQVLGQGVKDETYYNQLITNLTNIIINSGFTKVSIHVPFRISIKNVLLKISERIPKEIELSVLVINGKNDFFGFDYNNNGLVPFESTYIKIEKDQYLVWFEGLQFNNPKITKRFGNPLLINFWYCNHHGQFENENYKQMLLQDCINLSGANWRGFKAKQLPVSVFYCQKIAEFIGKFKQYNLEHIEISNLKPWFL